MKNSLLLFVFVALFASAQQSKAPYSVRVTYQMPDTLKAIQWLTEITINDDKSGFYGSSFIKGSLGLQAKANNKNVIFKLNNISSDSRLIAKGLHTKEIASGAVAWKYNWQAQQPYKILITAIVDSASQSAYYTGYVFLPKELKWKFIASYKLPGAGYIKSPALVTAANTKKNCRNKKLAVKQAWVQTENGGWKELTEAIYSSNIQGKTGTDSGSISISGSALESNVAQEGTVIKASAHNIGPVFSVSNHVDSAAQAEIDKSEITAAINKDQSDTTGFVNGVYYKHLQLGAGDHVTITDTLTVHYKGWLLKDGTVFDQTKDKPATFPLNRLIKGWQYGLIKCRVGGKIRLIIPSGLAYSIRSRSKDIPPNSVLVFDVEVIKAKKAA